MNVHTTLAAALSDRYRIDRELGAGGMATVWLAHDLKHDRDVAIKVLHPDLGAALGAERFLSEIKTTAKLQHPHILPLLDSGEAGSLLYYVMPVVTGETLRARLERERQLPIPEAVRIAREVASALDYAHRHDVIHRDIKPENILLHDGSAIVADFGIALAVQTAGGQRMTQTGLSLGTPQYMSPEQAMGEKTIDARADIYALGAVTYEMLTGDAPFIGASVQAIVAKVIGERPTPVRTVRDTVPEHVEHAVLTALAKLPADRFATAAEFGAALGNTGFVNSVTATTSAAGARRASKASLFARGVPWVIAAAATAFAIVARFTAPAIDVPTTRYTESIAGDVGAFSSITGGFAVSADGKRYVVLRREGGRTQLYMRALDDPEPRLLTGTDSAVGTSCFTPDGGALVFFTATAAKQLVFATGAIQTVASMPADLRRGLGSCTAQRDVIIAGGTRGLLRMSPNGGAVVPLTRVDLAKSETAHGSPSFLLDGRTIAFTLSDATGTHIAWATLDGKVVQSPIRAQAFRQVAPEIAVYSVGNTLMAARFDAKRLTVDAPVVISDNLYSAAGRGVLWAVSPTGTLLLLRGGSTSTLALVGRDGREESLVAEARSYANPRVSPDGQRVAANAAVGDRTTSNIWMYSRITRLLTPFTTKGGMSNPVWSRDGRRLTFTATPDSVGTGRTAILWSNADGSGLVDTLLPSRQAQQFPFGWTADGKTLIYDEQSNGLPMQVRTLRLGDTTGTAVVDPKLSTRLPSISPDGEWVAYQTTELGQPEIFVSPLSGKGGRVQVSSDFGEQPVWSRSGRELFYRSRGSIVAVTVQTKPTFAVLGKTVLFEDKYRRDNTLNWDVFPGDQQFVMVKPAADARLTVVTNWLPELRARLGIK